MIIGCIRIGLAQHTHTEFYKTEMENILSNSFLVTLVGVLDYIPDTVMHMINL
jgi:hypothetical protein